MYTQCHSSLVFSYAICCTTTITESCGRPAMSLLPVYIIHPDPPVLIASQKWSPPVLIGPQQVDPHNLCHQPS